MATAIQSKHAVALIAAEPSASAEQGTEAIGATPPIGDQGTKEKVTQVGEKYGSYAATNDLVLAREGL